MLECNKNYATLVLNYVLKSLKETISASEIRKRYKNNNILKDLFVNAFPCLYTSKQ